MEKNQHVQSSPLLIPISDREALHRVGCFVERSTLRKWSSLRTHPKLLVTVARRLYLDVTEWSKIVSAAIADRDRRAARLEAQAARSADPTRPRRGRPRKVEATINV